jgi:hypothetical protein
MQILTLEPFTVVGLVVVFGLGGCFAPRLTLAVVLFAWGRSIGYFDAVLTSRYDQNLWRLAALICLLGFACWGLGRDLRADGILRKFLLKKRAGSH